MKSPEITALRKKQDEILDLLYTGQPDEILRQAYLQQYDATVSALQSLHPDGVNAPCRFCDVDLYQMFSDLSKDVKGFRLSGDFSVAECKDKIEKMREEQHSGMDFC
jgi:hypothetical protein